MARENAHPLNNMSRPHEFYHAFKINDVGYTRCVDRHEVQGTKFDFGKNGLSWARDDTCPFIVIKRYKNGQATCLGECLSDNPGKGDKVMSIEFCGFKDVGDRHIPKWIRNQIIALPCAHCGTVRNIEVDHKHAVRDPLTCSYNAKEVGLEDFQPLCKHCNCLKRTLYKKATEHKSREYLRNPDFKYGYPPYMSGTDFLDIHNPEWDSGTYWRDIVKFKVWQSTRMHAYENLYQALNQRIYAPIQDLLGRRYPSPEMGHIPDLPPVNAFPPIP